MKCLFHFFFLFLSMVIVTMLSSCAYYNTFYNAEKYFAEAQKRPLTAQGRPNAQAIEDYNKVIRKCGVILTEYKDSKWVDNALFLLAKSLYYRGNNQIQALEKFEDLILFYPDSPFYNDSVMYIARIKYELNQKDEAFEILRNFIQNNAYRNDHPKALIEIADLFIQEKNYLQAQFYLTMLTERFPKSDKFAEGFLLLGKTYFDNNNFIKALEVFKEISSKRVPKRYQNDALYYIAYSYFNLKDYEKAHQTIRSLERKEFRVEKISEQNILFARVLAELNRHNDAIEKLEAVAANSPRSLISAEAVYYIAEIQFRKLHDYEKAIENYNRVRRESQRSDFADRSVTRSAVASQILQYYRQGSDLSAEQLIAEQFKLAEYYLYELSQPDSALFIYNKIPQQKKFIQQKIDSLLFVISEFEAGTLNIQELFTDSILVETDTVAVNLEADSLNIDNSSFDKTLDSFDIDKVRGTLSLYQKDLDLYINEFIPHSYFIRMVINKQITKNDKQVDFLFDLLKKDYPENKYTEAAYEFLADKPVTYLTKYQKYQLARYDYAMNYYLTDKETFFDSLNYIVGIIDSLTITDLPALYDKSLFSLGFIYYFDLADSLTAKTYLDTLIKYSPASEYAVFSKKFYDGQKFLKHDRLAAIIEFEQREAEALADSLNNPNNTDSDSLETDFGQIIDDESYIFEYHEELKPDSIFIKSTNDSLFNLPEVEDSLNIQNDR